MGKLIFMWAPASPHHLPHQGCWEPLDLSDSDDINEVINTKYSYDFQTCGLEMVVGTEVVVAPGLFYGNCGSGPLEASEAIADGLKWHLLGCLFGENLPVS